MTADWIRLARSSGVSLSENAATVQLGERSHRVTVLDEGDSYRLTAVVASPSAVARMSSPIVFAWQRNRSSRLVGFRVDQRGRLVGEGWLPKDGVTAAEFQLVLRAVAAESDRLEQLVTGRDTE